MRKVIFVCCLLLLACRTQSVVYTTYTSDDLGISFEYPESWILDEQAQEVNVATAEGLFVADATDFSGGAVANFSALPAEVVNNDVVTTLEQFATSVATSDDVEQVNVIESLTVDGHEAAQTRIQLTAGTTLMLTMIVGEERVLLAAAVFDEPQYEDMLEHMMATITFAE